jgi:hypothetical protein
MVRPHPIPTIHHPHLSWLRNSGNLGFGPRVKNTLQDEDTWSMIVNIGEPNQKGKDADKNWVLTVSNKRSR